MLISILVSLVAILIVHVAGSVTAWYDTVWWLDVVMHIAGGAWVALVFTYLSKNIWRILDFKNKFIFSLVLCLGFVTLVGVFWEFYEYLRDVYTFKLHPLNYAPNPLTLPDTLSDLLNDLIGGSLTFIVFYAFSHRPNRLGANIGDKYQN